MNIDSPRAADTVGPSLGPGRVGVARAPSADALTPAQAPPLGELLAWLPGQDPSVAEQALWDVLSRHEGSGRQPLPLAALLALDGAARHTCERLLCRYVDGDAQQRLFARRTLASALRLSQALIRAYGRIVDAAQDLDDEDAGATLVRLLSFRRVEIVLRMFRYKRRNADHWRALHDTYAFARARELHAREVCVAVRDGLDAVTTVEREYIQILLLDAVNSGQLSPQETLAASRLFVAWSKTLCLRHDRVQGLAVDLRVAEGPARNDPGSSEWVFHLDTGPAVAAIEEDLERLRCGPSLGNEATQHAKVSLLAKLAALLRPVPTRIERRGERVAEVSTVQVLAGLPQLVDALRRAALLRQEAAPPSGEEPTIQAFGGPTRAGPAVEPCPADAASPGGIEAWQIRDRSASGCRMRGRTADLNRVVPGSLIAIRARETAPWTLAVVRRLRRLMVDHVEIGVEHVGGNPRYVKVVMDEGYDPSAAPPGPDARCIGALYFPAREDLHGTPVRTLLLPAREFRCGRHVTLLSSSAMYAVRLAEPIRRERDFVWASFTIVSKLGADGAPRTTIDRSTSARV